MLHYHNIYCLCTVYSNYNVNLQVDEQCLLQAPFYISLLNISCLFILGILHGILGMMGAVYCNYPNFIYIFGCFMSGLWLAESSAELILVINRVLSILVPSLEKCCSVVAVYICGFVHLYFLLIIGFGYIDDSADVYNNMLHTVWDITIAMLLQVLIISLLNFFACSVYVHMMYVIPSEFLMHFAQFCWLLIHSLPTVIFLALNTSIRNNSKRIVNSFSEKYSKAIFKKETLVTSVTATQSTTN
uniref:Uncharacterized protein n=1 Tax=Ditylenchus dipsaci TaxID=166011 RepID=A0A915DTZ8_9BILA